MKRYLHTIIGGAMTLGTVGAFAQEGGEGAGTLSEQLSTQVTGEISSLVTVVGTVLLAGLAIPVAKKAYRIVKSALGAA